ncbi:MAG: hypothetical protein Q9168_005573 [Polycauliona sp. 1 TL-2023]
MKKRDMILEQSEMRDIIGWTQSSEPEGFEPASQSAKDGAGIIIRSNNYVGVGCDLRDIARLSKILEEDLQIGNCLVLCSAEVSITYMDVEAADALISWAAQYDDVRFCMLEQLLPQGLGHPFAQKMLHHFVNLGTPLRCVQKYPLLQDQETRFLRAGFHSIKSQDLWHLWQDQSAVSPDLRRHLDQVEPFDEWEEFALFSSHYFILEARKSSTDQSSHDTQRSPGPKDKVTDDHSRPQESTCIAIDDSLQFNVLSSQTKQHRRFGASLPFSDHTIGFHGGIGDKGRLNTTTRYQDHALKTKDATISNPHSDIVARVCHTITAFDDGKLLLVGGRTSPDNALQDCWLYCTGQWKPAESLPIPLYRHSATAVEYGTRDPGVLIFGGKTTGGTVVNTWFLWREVDGWAEVSPLLEELLPRFGATIASTIPQWGVLVGGLTEAGVLCDETWEWNILYKQNSDTMLQLRCLKGPPVAPRFGACLTWSPAGLLIIGGISTSLIVSEEEVLRLLHYPFGKVDEFTVLEPTAISIDFGNERPLLVGHAICVSKDTLVIAGGGANQETRFMYLWRLTSSGSYWNMTTWTLNLPTAGGTKSHGRRFVAEMGPPPHVSARALHIEDAEPASPEAQSDHMTEAVQRVRVESEADFGRLMHMGRPFVIEGLDLGNCIKDWTVPDLIQKIGSDRLVTVHQAQGRHMNFQSKNFQYVKKPFGEFMKEVCDGSPQYLRSLNAEKAAEEPACFSDDFPGVADQFHLPKQLETVVQNQHSSPLRISGPVNMWLHYDVRGNDKDVMANVLCQIVGQKVVVLYPPIDAVHFKIPPGSSTSPLTVFHPDQRGSVNNPRHHIRAVLNPGDVLYIPPLWLHSASPLDNLSVSINVFFRNLKSGYTAGRDVYGNRDLQAYENGRRNVERMVKSMEGLPRETLRAYFDAIAKWHGAESSGVKGAKSAGKRGVRKCITTLRSRWLHHYRRRRIKCGQSLYTYIPSQLFPDSNLADEREPSCSGCERLGVPCPGLQERTTFIQEHPTASRKARNRITSLDPSSDASKAIQNPPSTGPLICFMTKAQASLSSQCLHSIKLASPPADYYASLFVSRFKTEPTEGLNPFSWLHYGLLNFNGDATLSNRFGQNLTQAFFGQYFALPHITNAAQLDYGRNLLLLKEALDVPAMIGSEDILGAILTAVIIEFVIQTSSNAWLMHIRALAEIIQTRGPELYQSLQGKSGLAMCRSIMTGHAIMTRKRSFFEDPQWRLAGPQNLPRKLYVELADIHVQVPGLLEAFDNLCSSDLQPPATFSALNYLRDQTVSLLNSLLAWRWDWERQSSEEVWSIPIPPTSHVPLDSTSGRPTYPSLFRFTKFVRAGEIGRYNSIVSILLNLLRDVSDDPSTTPLHLLNISTPLDLIYPTHRSPLILPSDPEFSSRNAAAEHIRCVEIALTEESHVSSIGLIHVLMLNLTYKALPAHDPLRLWIKRIYRYKKGDWTPILEDGDAYLVCGTRHPLYRWKTFYLPPREEQEISAE